MSDDVEPKSYPNLHAVPTKRLQINIVHTLIMAKGNINLWSDTVLKFLTDYRAEEKERDAEVEKIVQEAPAFRCKPCGYKGNGPYEDVFEGGLLCPQCGEEGLVETDLRDEILRRLKEKPLNDYVEMLECGDCGVGFENEPGEPHQIQDGLCNACARPRLLGEIERLKTSELQSAICSNEAQNCAHELRDGNRDQQARIDAALAVVGTTHCECPQVTSSGWQACLYCSIRKALRGEK